MKKKKNLINLIFSPKLLIIEWSVIILFCVFIGFSTKSKAESAPTYDLPLTIGIPEALANYGINSSVVESAKNGYLNILSGYGFDGSTSYTVFCDSVVDNDFVSIIVTSNLDITYYSQTSTDYLLTYQNISQHYVQFIYSIPNQTLSGGNFYGGWVNSWNNISKQSLANGVGWVLDSANEFSGYWVFPSGVPDTTGHATPPINDTGHFLPDVTPTPPTINPYTPNAPQFPTIDTTSLEKLIESLIDVTQYGFSYVSGVVNGAINNLLNNLNNILNYLIQSFNKGFNNIVGTIQDLATDFYNNMVSLFEPLLNGIMETLDIIKIGIDVFFAPYDSESFQESYENCQFINAVDGINDSIEEFEHAFSYAEERDYYTLYLGFIMDGYTVNYDLDFTWLYPLRQYYRPIIWAVVIYEFFVYFVSQLSDYIAGRSGK